MKTLIAAVALTMVLLATPASGGDDHWWRQYVREQERPRGEKQDYPYIPEPERPLIAPGERPALTPWHGEWSVWGLAGGWTQQ